MRRIYLSKSSLKPTHRVTRLGPYQNSVEAAVESSVVESNVVGSGVVESSAVRNDAAKRLADKRLAAERSTTTLNRSLASKGSSHDSLVDVVMTIAVMFGLVISSSVALGLAVGRVTATTQQLTELAIQQSVQTLK